MIKPWLELAILLVPVVCCPLILYMRLRYGRTSENKTIKPKGLGVRLIQLVAVLVIIPIAGVLSLEDKLTAEGAGILFGAMAGFALAGVRDPVPRQDNHQKGAPEGAPDSPPRK